MRWVGAGEKGGGGREGPDTSGLDVAGMALNTGTNETQMEKISGQISTLLPPIKYFGERGGGGVENILSTLWRVFMKNKGKRKWGMRQGVSGSSHYHRQTVTRDQH